MISFLNVKKIDKISKKYKPANAGFGTVLLRILNSRLKI